MSYMTIDQIRSAVEQRLGRPLPEGAWRWDGIVEDLVELHGDDALDELARQIREAASPFGRKVDCP